MCPQYLWIDTPHAYGRTTLKFRFLMGIFKFSDPMYRGSNIIVHQIQNFPQLLYIKLHLKMSGNINFFQFQVIWVHQFPPYLYKDQCVKHEIHKILLPLVGQHKNGGWFYLESRENQLVFAKMAHMEVTTLEYQKQDCQSFDHPKS